MTNSAKNQKTSADLLQGAVLRKIDMISIDLLEDLCRRYLMFKITAPFT